MYLVHQYVRCVEVFQDNGLRQFCDVGLFPKHTHLEYGVFLKKTLFSLYFHFMDFIFDFVNPSIFILTYLKNKYFLGGDMSFDLTI